MHSGGTGRKREQLTATYMRGPSIRVPRHNCIAVHTPSRVGHQWPAKVGSPKSGRAEWPDPFPSFLLTTIFAFVVVVAVVVVVAAAAGVQIYLRN